MSTLKIWAASAALISLLGRSALAQYSGNVSEAEASFRAGHALLKDKNYAAACAKFKDSQALDRASGTLLALAYCQELSGLFASARASYMAAAELAELENHSERKAAATERADALSPRVSKLVVLVPAELRGVPGLQVLCDGVALEPAAFGVSVAIDGGAHTVVASAPGRTTWVGTVLLGPDGDQKTLPLPVLDSTRAPPSAVHASPPLHPSPPAASAKLSSRQTLQRASLAFAAGGIVGLGLGTAFAVSAKAKKDEASGGGHCDDTGCDPRGVALLNDALSAARVSTWSFVAGGALAACGLTLYVASLRGGSDPQARGGGRPALKANVSLAEPRVYLTGTF